LSAASQIEFSAAMPLSFTTAAQNVVPAASISLSNETPRRVSSMTAPSLGSRRRRAIPSSICFAEPANDSPTAAAE
jgi:hypothetical protein